MHSSRCAFTLIELLVVLAIIAILAGMLLPAVSAVKTAAQSVNCQSNLRQLAMGANAYADENNGLLPMAVAFNGTNVWFQDADQCLGRYMELNYNDNGYWHRSVFACPAEPIGYAGTGMGYAINASINESFGVAGWRTRQSMRHTSKTIAFADGCRIGGAENPYNPGGSYVFGGWWADNDFGKPQYAIDWRNHGQTANLAMVDGHVEAGRFAGIPSSYIVMKSEE